MKRSVFGRRALAMAGAFSLLCSVSATALAGGPEIVSGPSGDPNCYVPWSQQTKFFKYPAKPGPYRIALANGFIANTWRIQMI
jgi:ribose transport system substrate-binding protein